MSGPTIVGWLFLNRPLNMLQLLCIGLILIGAVGLNRPSADAQ